MELEIITHSGKEIIVNVDNFDAKEYETKVNDHEINSIELGGILFSRIDLKMVLPKIEGIEVIK